jgi:site-specific DNA-methyltransferase (adenine-specific)
VIRPEIQSLATPIAQLKPHPQNVRQGDVGAISLSLEQHGQYRPIVVQQSTGFILAGNHTYKAAKALKWKDIAATYVDVDDEQALRILLIDNRANDLASYDDSALVEMLKALMDTELKLDGTGFDPSDLDQLLKDLEMETGNPVEGDPDAVPDDAPSKTVPGDVWLLGDHRLMCGDSTSPTDIEKLCGINKPVCIVTDPPYGIGIDGQKKNIATNPKHNRKAHEFRGWDNERPTAQVFNLIIGMNIPTVIWGGNYFADLLPATRGWIYWDKGQDGLTMSDGELAWTTENKPLRAVTVNRNALRNSVHPTQKPVEVVAFAIKYLDCDGIVLDLFGGSGSTLIAAHQTGRTAYLMELDPHYCDVICKRFQQATGITPIAEATGNEHSFIE